MVPVAWPDTALTKSEPTNPFVVKVAKLVRTEPVAILDELDPLICRALGVIAIEPLVYVML